jgi:hypothetical protein
MFEAAEIKIEKPKTLMLEFNLFFLMFQMVNLITVAFIA